MLALPLFAALLIQTSPATPLESQLRGIIASSGVEVAVGYRTLDGKTELFIDGDKPFHAASTMKVPIMIELFRQARSRQLSLDDTLPVRNEFRSIVDGSPYQLSEGDDSDSLVYAAVGKRMPLRQLCDLMITVSSNFAANLLIEKLGVENIRRTVSALGADGMQVLRGVEDQKAFDKGMNNTTTARGLVVLLDRIGHGQAVDSSADAEMIEILKRQKFNDAIPAGLPAGTPVAHKTGNITRINHDAAIVFGTRPYVLVLLVRGIEDQKKSAALMAELSRAVYEATAR
ncbi:MAG TPA: serine hydrolase [Vicinamibacterales bacterium]|nr:serine hydrolase [Vicinamibacterales bacterium]